MFTLIVPLYYPGILQVVREGPDQTVWRHTPIWAFAVCICLEKGRIQLFAGDGDSAEAPLTQNFNFDYLWNWMCVKLLSDWQTVQTLIRCRRMQHLIEVYTVAYCVTSVQRRKYRCKRNWYNFKGDKSVKIVLPPFWKRAYFNRKSFCFL